MESLEMLAEQIARLETQFLQIREEARSEFSAVRAAIRAGDEETQRLMRVLHEDVIARLSLIE